MICLLPELSSLPWSSLKHWSASGGPLVFLGYPRLWRAWSQSNIFNILILCNSEMFILVSWTFWGLSTQDGTMQAAVISVIVQLSIFQTYLLHPPAHEVGLTDPNRTSLAKCPNRWAVCLCLGGDLNVFVYWRTPTMHFSTRRSHPAETSALGCRNLENPTCTSSNLKLLLLSFFII